VISATKLVTSTVGLTAWISLSTSLSLVSSPAMGIMALLMRGRMSGRIPDKF
jgi:hypothetical protein